MFKFSSVASHDLHNLTDGQFRLRFRNRKPVILPGSVRSWPAHDRWQDAPLSASKASTPADSAQLIPALKQLSPVSAEPAAYSTVFSRQEVCVFTARDNCRFVDQEEYVERVAMSFGDFWRYCFSEYNSTTAINASCSTPDAATCSTVNASAETSLNNRQCVKDGISEIPAAGVIPQNSSHDCRSGTTLTNDRTAVPLIEHSGSHGSAPACAASSFSPAHGQRLYLRCFLNDLSPDLQLDLRPPEHILRLAAPASSTASEPSVSVFNRKRFLLWIGTSGNVTPLHYDRCHGFLCQFRGVKRVTLISPKCVRKPISSVL